MKTQDSSSASSWTLSRRLLVGFGCIVAILLLWSGVAIVQLGRIRSQATAIGENELPAATLCHEIEIRVAEIGALILHHILSTDAALKQQYELAIETNRVTIANLLKELEPRMVSSEEQRLFRQLQQTREDYIRARAPVLELSRAGKTAEALALNKEKAEPAMEHYIAAAGSLADLVSRAMAENVHASIQLTRHATVLNLAGALAVLLFSLGVGWFTYRSLARVLNPLAEELQQGSVQVASAAAQVTSSSQSLAQGASEQAASLEETSASLEELTAMTQRNAANAQQARHLASQTRQAVEAGQTDMSQLARAMDDIQQASNEISKIIKTIDEIAFQTNLLALNAAVEAARAGEAGMGFAVVADEVRALAQRAAAAARETAEKIENSVAKSQTGAQMSQRVAQHLQDILTKARQVDELVAEIAAASQEQSQGIGQINDAVSQMDKVTQANAAAAEQSAASAQELNAQAATLRQAVLELQALIGSTPSRLQPDFQPNPEPEVSQSILTRPALRLSRSESQGTAQSQNASTRARTPSHAVS